MWFLAAGNRQPLRPSKTWRWKMLPRLSELRAHTLYGSLKPGSGGTAVSAVADVLANASLGSATRSASL